MNIKVGKMIKTLRKERKMSLRELAKEVGVSFANISYIENGKIETSKKILRKISEVLNAYIDAPKKGLNTVINNKTVLEWGKIFLNLSKRGLKKRSIKNMENLKMIHFS